MKMRSDDPAYLELVDRWWSVLLPKIGRFLVERGGNILMVQVDHLYSLMPWQLGNLSYQAGRPLTPQGHASALRSLRCFHA